MNKLSALAATASAYVQLARGRTGRLVLPRGRVNTGAGYLTVRKTVALRG